MFLKLKDKAIAFIKKNGLKAALGIVLFYLIRDLTLYVLIPWLIFKNVNN